MSTTWVFVGLLCVRELAIGHHDWQGKVQGGIPTNWKRFP